MNKAFVKEPEPGVERCPRCESPGETVREETLVAQLPPELLAGIAKTANFCATSSCAVVYFDAFERMILTSDLSQLVYPKHPDAPICPCFGLTCSEIDQDIQEGGVARTRAAIERAKSPEAQCQTKSPRGQSCVSDVQKYYIRHKGS